MENINNVLCESTVTHINNYWKAIYLLITKPHTVNKRIAGSCLELILKCNERNVDHVQYLFNSWREHSDCDSWLKSIKLPNGFVELSRSSFQETLESSQNSILVAVNKLLPKKSDQSVSYEFIITGNMLNRSPPPSPIFAIP